LALLGKHSEAVAHYKKNEKWQNAILLLTQLKKFGEAQELSKKHANKKGMDGGTLLDPSILIKQAEFEKDSGNWKESASLYQQAGRYKEAIDIFGKKNNLDSIMEICRNLDRGKNETEIQQCAKIFR
jgi:tetratricopeptide (TPR) repeat protein